MESIRKRSLLLSPIQNFCKSIFFILLGWATREAGEKEGNERLSDYASINVLQYLVNVAEGTFSKLK